LSGKETSTAGWPDWVDRITLVCGMTPGDRPMLAAWAGLLGRDGTLAAEAIEATEWVALNDPQTWRPNLLAALQRRLKSQAARESPEHVPAPESQSCAICGGLDAEGFAREAVGRVFVPDPDRLAERKVVVVYCRCPLGRWFRQATPSVKARGVECRVWTLDDVAARFEAMDPAPGQSRGWKGYLAWWAALKAEEQGAVSQARESDRRHGRLAASLASSWGRG